MIDFQQGCAYVDEKYVPIAEAKISLLDWGFLHSDATYDVAHVWEGRFFRLDDHIERFQASMNRLHLSAGLDAAAIEAILTGCVRNSGLRESYVEMGCTRGLPTVGSRDPRSCRNRFFAFAIPFVWIADPAKQQRGLDLTISRRQRIPPESVDPMVKNYHWLDLVMAQYDAYADGGDNAVVVDARGNLVEGPGFNIFVVKDGRLGTPAKGALEGITRRTVIEIAEREGIVVECRDVPAAHARRADEAFICSTAGGIMPIGKFDGEAVGAGEPGPITRQLRSAYWALHEDPEYYKEIDY